MNLCEAVESYIQIKRSMGAVFSSDQSVLRAFARIMGDIPINTLSQEACKAFCQGDGPPTRWWERKDQALRGFFNYLMARGHLGRPLLPDHAPRIPRSFEAYIYSHEELRRLLDGTVILKNSRYPLSPLTLRTLLMLLYGAGLRPSEGLRLRCCDVDLGSRVLTIWNTKFFKSRLVPVGNDLKKALISYADARRCLPMPAGTSSVFFASRHGTAISLATLEGAFARVRAHAGITRPMSARWQPRLHDLRHAFAVHRLIAWYREGADVQSCLPLLATYLGHINISGTQTYLSMTPELLSEASKRFECYAAIGAKENGHE